MTATQQRYADELTRPNRKRSSASPTKPMKTGQ